MNEEVSKYVPSLLKYLTTETLQIIQIPSATKPAYHCQM